MRDLRKDLRRYIDLRQALGYKLRKHEPRLTEFIGFLEARGTDRITTKLAEAAESTLPVAATCRKTLNDLLVRVRLRSSHFDERQA